MLLSGDLHNPSLSILVTGPCCTGLSLMEKNNFVVELLQEKKWCIRNLFQQFPVVTCEIDKSIFLTDMTSKIIFHCIR